MTAMQDAMQLNAQLRATLSGLQAERSAAAPSVSEAQQGAQAKLAGELSKLELKHRQTIEMKELQVKQLQEMLMKATNPGTPRR